MRSDALEAALEEVGLEDALLALRRLEHALHVLHQHDAAPLDLAREHEGVEERAAADADRLWAGRSPPSKKQKCPPMLQSQSQ